MDRCASSFSPLCWTDEQRLDTFIQAESSPLTFPVPLVTHFWLPGLAEERRSRPNPGWTKFRRTAQNFGRALSFIKLSYVRYRLKTVTERHTFLEQKSEPSRPNPAF